MGARMPAYGFVRTCDILKDFQGRASLFKHSSPLGHVNESLWALGFALHTLSEMLYICVRREREKRQRVAWQFGVTWCYFGPSSPQTHSFLFFFFFS